MLKWTQPRNYTFQPPTSLPRTREMAEQEQRLVGVMMLQDGIAALPMRDALNAILTTIKDDARFTPGDIERLANLLGREAHERARR